MNAFAMARRNMVDCQIRPFDVTDRPILTAMEEIHREAYATPGQEALAYFDQNLALMGPDASDDPRVMLAPMVLARLVQALAIKSGAKVLDVGGGFGYSAALIARLGADVTLLESRPDLADRAGQLVSSSGISATVRVATGALRSGVPDQAPFAAILVNGAVEERPTELLDQLDDGGRLACLQAEGRVGKAVIFVRSGSAIGFRALFDASAPVLTGFRRSPAFAF